MEVFKQNPDSLKARWTKILEYLYTTLEFHCNLQGWEKFDRKEVKEIS